MSRLLQDCLAAGVPKLKRKRRNKRKSQRAWSKYRPDPRIEDELTVIVKEVPVKTFHGVHYRTLKKPSERTPYVYSNIKHV